MSKKKLQELLTQELKLKSPRFVLEKSGDQFFGSVISETFKGKGDLKRQRMIWNVLDDQLDRKSAREVGMILAFTPDEWDWELVDRVTDRAPGSR